MKTFIFFSLLLVLGFIFFNLQLQPVSPPIVLKITNGLLGLILAAFGLLGRKAHFDGTVFEHEFRGSADFTTKWYPFWLNPSNRERFLEILNQYGYWRLIYWCYRVIFVTIGFALIAMAFLP